MNHKKKKQKGFKNRRVSGRKDILTKERQTKKLFILKNELKKNKTLSYKIFLKNRSRFRDIRFSQTKSNRGKLLITNRGYEYSFEVK